jgi:hypothetical protein
LVSPDHSGLATDPAEDDMARFRNYWIYSAGLAVAWAVVFVVILRLKGQHGAQAALPVFLGFCIGWVSTTLARSVYPPPKKWRS